LMHGHPSEIASCPRLDHQIQYVIGLGGGQ